MTIIFVYGTLKRGFCRHAVIASQQFLGAAKTTPSYLMYDLGDYPGLVKASDPNSGNAIHGELYRVDDACLEQLDLIECVAQNLYRRAPVAIQAPWNEQQVVSYFYLLPTEKRHLISDWQS